MRVISLALISAGLAACRAESTQLTLYVESDLPRDRATGFRVRAITGDGSADDTAWARAETANSIGILAPGGNAASSVRLEISTTGPESKTAIRTVTRFSEKKNISLHVCISDRCLNSSACDDIYQPILSISDLADVDQDAQSREMSAGCVPLVAPPDDGGVFADAEPEKDAELPDAEPDPMDSGAPDAGMNTPSRESWAGSIGTMERDTIEDVLIDPRGNIIVGGTSGRHGFVSFYRRNGEPVWRANFSGMGSSKVWAVAQGPNEEIYATGEFTGNVTVLSTELRPTAAMREEEIFVLRIAQEGPSLMNYLVAGEDRVQTGQGLAVGNDGTVYLAGNYDRTFNIFSQCSFPDSSGNTRDIYVAALNAQLDSCSWGHQIRSEGEDFADDLKVDGLRLVLAGTVGEAVFIDDVAMPGGVAQGQSDLLLAELSLAKTTDNHAITIGGTGEDEYPRVALGEENFIVGTIESPGVFAADRAVPLPSGSIALQLWTDPKLVLSDPPDRTEFAVSATTAEPRAIALQNEKQIIAGRFRGWMRFGLKEYRSVPPNEHNAFVAFADKMTLSNILSFGAGAEVDVRRVAARGNDIVVVGEFEAGSGNSMSFPEPYIVPLMSAGNKDAFIYSFELKL